MSQTRQTCYVDCVFNRQIRPEDTTVIVEEVYLLDAAGIRRDKLFTRNYDPNSPLMPLPGTNSRGSVIASRICGHLTEAEKQWEVDRITVAGGRTVYSKNFIHYANGQKIRRPSTGQ